MGQAKQRGTKDQRVAQAKAIAATRRAEIEAENKRKEAEHRERLAALPPQERKRAALELHKSRMFTAAMAGTLIGALMELGNEPPAKG